MGNTITSCIDDDASQAMHLTASQEMTLNSTSPSDQWIPQWQNHLARLQRSLEKMLMDDQESSVENARIFHALLQLYAHKDVINTLKAFATTESGRKSLTFYIPQLTTFLIHGGFEQADKLRQLILHVCARDARFAHRMVWFLLAFCKFDENDESQKALMDAIGANGGISVEHLADLLRRKIQPDTIVESSGVVDDASVDLDETETAKSIPSLPLSILRNKDAPLSDSPRGQKESDDPNAPHPHPETGSTFSPFHTISPFKPNNPSHFLELVNFTEALTSLSDNLRHIPGFDRNEMLLEGLHNISCTFLPSNYLYLPLSVTFLHQTSASNQVQSVVGVHGSESIVFSTKERCPYLCVLEIVDATAPAVSGEDGEALGDEQRNSRTSSLNATEERESVVPPGVKAWWKRRRKDFVKFKTEVEGNIETLIANNLSPEKQRQPKEPKETPKGTPLHASMSQLQRPPPSPSPILERPSRSSSAPSLERDVSMSSMKSSNVDMGQWETYAIAETASVVVEPSKNGGRGGFVGFKDCLIDDAMFFPEEGKTNKEQTSAEVINVMRAAAGASTPTSTPKRGLTSNQLDSLSKIPAHGQEEFWNTRNNQSPSAESLDRSIVHSETETDADGDLESDQEPEPLLFSESWNAKEDRIRADSSYGHLPGWRLVPIIVKSFDDLRQEQMVSQIIAAMANILKESGCPVYVRAYDIIATQLKGTGGLIEAVPDTVSIDSLKRRDPSFTTLDDFFIRHFGKGIKSSQGYKKARRNFVSSMAGYAVVCYLLQIKDRHNGNILLDNEGHIVHIDWGFVFMSSPGKNLNFEAAPFKLTNEFVALMGGSRSSSFRRFRRLTARAFLELRKRREEIILLVEMLSIGNEDLGCFRGRPQAAIAALRERFRPDLVNEGGVVRYVDGLINQSLSNWTTKWYDEYQMCCVGVAA